MQTLKARRGLFAFLAILPLVFAAIAEGKIAPELGRATFHTAHFRIHYPPHYLALAEAFADRLENSYLALERDLRWTPASKIEVVLRGDTDVPNGFAEVFPYPRLVLNAVAPEPWGFFSESDDWIDTLAVHELTHVIANDETRGFFDFLRTFIGSAAKINPYQPAWLVEGLAVYEETAKTSRGRGRSVWNDMIVRTAVMNDLFADSGDPLHVTLDRLNDGVRPWPRGNSAYLYGYVLTESMATRAGRDAPAKISTENSGTFPFAIEGVAKDNLGLGYPALWNDAVARLKREYAVDLAKIEREPVTATRTLTSSGRRTRGLALGDGGKIYFIRDSERDGVGLSVLDHGVERNLTTWNWDGGTRLRLTPDRRYLVYSRIVPHREYSYYSDLFLYDLRAGEEIQITDGMRAADPEISPDFEWDPRAGIVASGSLYYVKNLRDGNQAIAAFRNRARTGDPIETTLYAGKGFARLGAPALGRGERSGWLAFSEKTLAGGERIRGIRIEDGGRVVEARAFTTPASGREVATTPEFAPDGSLLYAGGTGGVFNLFRISAAELGAKEPRAERITNLRTGAIEPTRPDAGAPLFAMVYGASGWNLAEVAPGTFSREGPGVRSLAEKLGAPAPEERAGAIPSTAREEKNYSVLPALLPKYWAPDVRKVTDGYTLGVQTSSYDAWEDHRYRLYGGRDTRATFPVWDLNYQFDGFYPTFELSVRRENNYFATYTESNQIDTDEIHAYMPAGWDSFMLLGFTRTTSRFLDEKETSGGFELGWLFDRMRVFDDSIDRTGESGIRGRVEMTGHVVGKERFTSLAARLDLRVPSPIPRHFFRLGANYAASNNENLSALYYVGGGEETIAGQADFLLRGYPQGTVFGRRILTSNFEYVFPVADVFRGFATFPAYFESARLKLFFDVASAESVANDAGGGFRRFPNAVGAQVLGDVNLLYRVPVTLALGFDYGLAKDLGGEGRVVFGLFSRLP